MYLVYYRIKPEQARHAASRIDALLAAMAPHCGKPPRRLCRCDDPTTWMEIYEDIADFATFISHYDAAVAQLQYGEFTDGKRHPERFCLPSNGTGFFS